MVSDSKGPIPVNMEAKAGFHLENCSVGQNIL